MYENQPIRRMFGQVLVPRQSVQHIDGSQIRCLLLEDRKSWLNVASSRSWTDKRNHSRCEYRETWILESIRRVINVCRYIEYDPKKLGKHDLCLIHRCWFYQAPFGETENLPLT